MNQKNQSQLRNPEYFDKDLIDFFALLLKIDRRVNPHLYTNKSKKK